MVTTRYLKLYPIHLNNLTALSITSQLHHGHIGPSAYLDREGGTGRTHVLEAMIITSRQIWGQGVIECGHVVNKDTIDVVENDANRQGGGREKGGGGCWG